MKKYFTTLLDVFNRVISFTTSSQNAPVTNSISALSQGINNTFINKVNAIKALIYPQDEQSTGYATQKNMFKKAAANLAMIVINGAKSYSKSINDETLFGEINFNYTKLRTLKDSEFADKITGLMNLLSPLQGPLQAYGVQPQAFTDVATAVALYLTMLTAPEDQIVTKEAINKLLALMFKDTNNFLRIIIDPIVLTLKDSQQLYYFGYRAARKHVPHGTRHNRINATLVDELDTPFVNAKVTVDAYTDPKTKKTYEAVSGYTDINGMATVEEFFPGNRTVTVSGDNIATKTFGPFYFELGKAINKVFTCKPAFNNIPASSETKTEKTAKEKVSK